MLEVHAGLVIASKYRLACPLAKGGMGSVWTAQHVTLDVPVAVKFMHPRHANSNDLRARFEREAKSAAQLRSPNVVQILDYGIEDATPYLVMERLQGEDLGERLARERRLSMNEALPILMQIGKALRRAHEERIVHRDLKPGNIFLMEQDDELLVKVLDFGIAKWLRQDDIDDSTTNGFAIGSPHYMSPEQVRGVKEVDHRTDLWALGVIFYRMLTGYLPFPGLQQGDVFVKICKECPIAPTVHVPDLDCNVDAFMAKALCVDVEQRFQTIKEMMDALTLLTTRPSASTTRTAAEDSGVWEEATTTTYEPHGSRELTEPMVRVDEPPTNIPVTQPFLTETQDATTEELPGRGRTRMVGVAVGTAFVCGVLVFVGFYVTKQWEGPPEQPSTTPSTAALVTMTPNRIVPEVARVERSLVEPLQTSVVPTAPVIVQNNHQDMKKIDKPKEKTLTNPPTTTMRPTIPETTLPPPETSAPTPKPSNTYGY